MQMTPDEIRRNYREAKNKNRQIDILADLNECSRKEIEKILNMDSKKAENCEEPKHIPTENSSGEIIGKLFARLDILDKEIKEKEAEYKNIIIAIEVLENLRKEDYGRIIQQ